MRVFGDVKTARTHRDQNQNLSHSIAIFYLLSQYGSEVAGVQRGRCRDSIPAHIYHDKRCKTKTICRAAPDGVTTNCFDNVSILRATIAPARAPTVYGQPESRLRPA
jgi:hypothetical protein